MRRVRGQGLGLVRVWVVIEGGEGAVVDRVRRAGVHYVEVDGVARCSGHDWVLAPSE